MDKIQFNTARISVLSDSIQSLTLDLEEAIGNDEKKRAYSASNAVNSLAESISSEAGKIDQLRFEDTTPKPSNEKPESPTVVQLNTNNGDHHKPVLNPAWYEYSTDGKVNDLALVDGLNHCFNEVQAISELLMDAGDNADAVISDSTISQTALILSDKMEEANHFVDLWRKANTDIR